MNKKLVTTGCVVAAVILVIIAFVYFTHSANTLPAFFPGYDAAETKTHVKHGLAALVLAGGALVLAWFASGPSETPPPE